MFSCEFYETSKNTFFTEDLWTTASKYFKLDEFEFHSFPIKIPSI